MENEILKTEKLSEKEREVSNLQLLQKLEALEKRLIKIEDKLLKPLIS